MKAIKTQVQILNSLEYM